MSVQEVYEMLSSITYQGNLVPVAYDHFTQNTHKVMPPFILYRNNTTDTYKADNIVWDKDPRYIIDLCIEKKDITLETQIETLLENNKLSFDKDEDYLDSEQIYQIRYYI